MSFWRLFVQDTLRFSLKISKLVIQYEGRSPAENDCAIRNCKCADPLRGYNDCENRASRNSPSLAVALN